MSSSLPDHRSILIARCDNIGDVVMLTPAILALRNAYPNARIALLTSPTGSQIAALLPWLDEVLVEKVLWQDVAGELPFDPARERVLIENLRARRFDAAFIFTSFRQTPYAAAYAAYLAGIPIRVGHSKEFGGGVLSHAFDSPPDGLHQTERNLRLLERYGLEAPDKHLRLEVSDLTQERTAMLLRGLGLRDTEPFVAMVPGASCEARRYPAERFGEVARLVSQRSELPVVMLGSASERPTIADALNESTLSLIGKTNAAEYAAVLASSQVVISNNSSAIHIADAFDRPVVVTYSGTDLIEQWSPRYAPSRLLQQPTPCAPCYGFTCGYSLECLDLKPAMVAGAALDLLHEVAV